MASDPNDNIYRRAAEFLQDTDSLFVMTGAGISAESGIPTFRGANGLWRKYSVQDLATPDAFARDPTLVWEWYRWRQDIILRAKPNAAHHALVRLERRIGNFLLLTQNVDDLHRRAGTRNLREIHGNIFRTKCSRCGAKQDSADVRSVRDSLPRCTCGGLLRPDVIWFGEIIPSDVWNEALTFLVTAGVALFCGTSGVVWPAAGVPEIAIRQGLKTIEINPEPTPISEIVHVSVRAKAGTALPEILRFLSH
ncbi:MAG: NAD-dependent deacylase [candidate division WOR-3 bacterium]|nr:MAG: NAD-dependent deacylase [candidate division WOR-3 bacterium]